MKEANGLDTVIIDYLQLLYCKDNLMNNNGQKRFLYKEEEMEIIVRDLKALAIELNVPIIILSQLSRMAETNDKPEISDIGVIGKYADVVLLITNKSNDNHDYNTTDIIITKDRNGKTRTINLRFDKATGSFNEFDE